jgi:hypothetical protein
MEYLRNIIYESDFDMPADVCLCVATWAAAGLLVGGFWYGVFSVARKLIA